MKSQPLSVNNAKSIKQLAVVEQSHYDSEIIHRVAISPDNCCLAFMGMNNNEYYINILDYQRNKVIRALPLLRIGIWLGDSTQCLQYSPDGKYLALDDSGSLYIWDLEHTALVLKYPHQTIFPPINHPQISIQFVDIDQRQCLRVASLEEILTIDISNNHDVRIVRFDHDYTEDIKLLSPDGRFVITIPHNEGAEYEKLYLRTLPSYETIWSYPITSTFWSNVCQAICFHPSSKLLAVGQRSQVSIFQIPEGELVCTLRLPRDFDVESIAFSPDGELLAMSLLKGQTVQVSNYGDEWADTDFDIVNDCTIWDWEWGAPIMQLPEVWGKLRFSSDGSRLVVSNHERIQVWGVDSQQEDETDNDCSEDNELEQELENLPVVAAPPQQRWLLPRVDEDGNPIEPEIPGAEDIWVRIIPPSREDDNKRQQFMATLFKNEDSAGLELVHYELWLTYGGTNLAALIGKRDPETGRALWEQDKDGNWVPMSEEVRFDEEGRLTKEEFDERVNKLPSRVVELWYSQVLEVVPQWDLWSRVNSEDQRSKSRDYYDYDEAELELGRVLARIEDGEYTEEDLLSL